MVNSVPVIDYKKKVREGNFLTIFWPGETNIFNVNFWYCRLSFELFKEGDFYDIFIILWIASCI